MTGVMKQIPLTCSGHTRPVVQLDFSGIVNSGYYLISACKDGKPMLRQGDTGDWIGTFEGHQGAVWGVALNKDATLAASGAADFTGKLWNAVTGEELHSFKHNHIVKCVHFSSDSQSILFGSNEKTVKVFDLNQPGKCKKTFEGHTSGIRNALFFRNDKLIISGADDKTVRIWDYVSDKIVKKFDFDSVPNSIEVSHDGSIIIITNGSIVSFYNADDFTLIKEISLPSGVTVNWASLHLNKSIFVCAGNDFKVYKYDFNTETELESYKGHFGPVHCVKFSPDGELYASGSEDGTLRLWQTTVGKTYGLWKCMDNSIGISNATHPKEEIATN